MYGLSSQGHIASTELNALYQLAQPLMLLREIAAGAQFLAHLPSFLHRRVDALTARASIAERLARRARDFLANTSDLIYGHAASPYRALLREAGCEYGDLERLVVAEGVEGTLKELCERGVYLTTDEFKGRAPVRRGTVTIAIEPGGLRNPRTAAHLPAQTSGSGGARTPVPIDLGYVYDCAANSCLMLETRNGGHWIKGHWAPLGGGAMISLLQFSAFGAPSARWFSQVDPRTATLHPRYRWAAWAMAAVSHLAGMRLPHPEYVPPDDPLPVVLWMRDVLRRGATPHLLTYPSSAARACEAARSRAIDIAGAQFTVGGGNP